MADHVLHAVADELVGDRHALLGIGDIVALLEVDLLAEDAARLVDVLDCLGRSLDELGAKGRVRARDRAGDAHLDLGLGGARHRQSGRQGDAIQPIFLHA